MCDITPFEHGVSVYSTPDLLIVWNFSATFNTYRKCAQTKEGCVGGWENVECNTNIQITNYEEAEEYAKRLISIGGVA
jgi:hypothetical protein